ncbi:uncharacterized protein CTRU02_210435 [Colletotrichum truncatum]|uniref:Uncharacterized protein n=1 Tax=Colletotrichum truncatum TaxID=5467 RepID=A0ACC3YPI8_COLTU|nr:uncharacterized protein CTRU02_13963 [Colletotrichum truncatum]KAF6782806.1 hypothetical protein CTRU02_13963 [Colletotrichum truncatum]
MLSQRFWCLGATLLSTFSQLASADIPDQAIELDLIFPRKDGKYGEASKGYPVLLNIQNPDVAYHYGYGFVWDIYSRNKNSYLRTAAHGSLGATILNNTEFGNNPHLEVGYTGHLAPGDYTFAWVFGMGAQCEITEQPFYSEFNLNPRISNGSFDFSVEKDGSEPTFTKTCPEPVGILSYASTTTYNSEATSVCGVTATATHDAEPCKATLSNEQATSVYSELGYAAATGSSKGAADSNLPSNSVAWLAGLLVTFAVMA